VRLGLPWRRRGLIKTAEELFEHVQLVERKRPKVTTFLRAPPRTILFPTDGQLEIRMRFAELAKKAKGKKRLSPAGIPWAAYYIKQGLEGYKAKRRVAVPKVFKERLEKREELKEIVRVLLAQAK